MPSPLNDTFNLKNALLVYPESLAEGKDGEFGHVMLIHIYQSLGGEFLTKDTILPNGELGFQTDNTESILSGVGDDIGGLFTGEEFGKRLNSVLNAAKSNTATEQYVSTNPLTIALYMPPNVKESYQTEWENSGLGGDALSSFVKKIGLGESDQSIYNQITSGGISKMLGTFARNRLMEAAPTLLGSQFRVAFNPYMTFNFKTVKPRSFTFEFQLTPKSESEALTVWNIIRALKFYAAPSERKNDPTFWNFPSQFQIEFFSVDRTTNQMVRTEWLYATKRCVLSSIEINPTDLSVFAAHSVGSKVRGAAPVQIGLTLTFDELALLTQRDILNGH